MNFSLITFAQDVAAALSAAVVIAFFAWLYSLFRNWRLETSLTQAVQQNGIGWGIENGLPSFTVQVHNYSTATVRVRSVHFKMNRFHIELEPALRFGISQTPLTNEIVQPKFKRQHLSRTLEKDGILDSETMTLPPKTLGFWQVPTESIGKMDWKVEAVYITFEYPTVFGTSALVRMPVAPSALGSIKQVFDELSAAVFHKRPMVDPYALLGTKRPALKS